MWQYISSSFMASQYCYSMEMTRAMERHRQGEVRVIPILLRPVLFTGAPFAMLKMLPTNGKPVVSWRNRDSAFVDIALGIERVVQEGATKSSQVYQPGQPFGQLGQPSQPAWGTTQGSLQPQPAGRSQSVPPAGYSPPCRRSVVLQRLAFVSLFLGIVVAGILFTLFTFRIPACPSGSPCTGNPNFLSIAIMLLAVTLVAIFLIILWRRSIQARRRVKVIEEAERQRQEEARRREQEEDYYEQALQAYDRAPHLDPLARRGKGNALAALGRYDEALQSLQLSAWVMSTPLHTLAWVMSTWR